MAITVDYDDWSKEYSTRLGLTPTDREAMRPFRDAGALPPRQAEPRKFADGVFRGGGDPQTIYRQISQGIAGTPMPGVEIVPEATGTNLSDSQAWDLVRYIRSLAGNPSAALPRREPPPSRTAPVESQPPSRASPRREPAPVESQPPSRASHDQG